MFHSMRLQKWNEHLWRVVEETFPKLSPMPHSQAFVEIENPPILSHRGCRLVEQSDPDIGVRYCGAWEIRERTSQELQHT